MNEPPLSPPLPVRSSAYCMLAERSSPDTISGYVYDVRDLISRFVVELLVDGVPVALARAEACVADLEAANVGDGRYGFTFILAPEVLQGGQTAQVVVANTTTILGPPLDLRGSRTVQADRRSGVGAGRVDWSGGLLLTGWLAPSSDGSAGRVRVSVEGQSVADVRADRWRHLVHAGGAQAMSAFQLHLPERFADGRSKRVSVVNEAGQALSGSPLTLLAFPDGLETVVERLHGPEQDGLMSRARLFDALLPQSMPLTEFASWLERYPAPSPDPSDKMIAVVMIGDEAGAVAETLRSLEQQAATRWIAASLPSEDRLSFQAEEFAAFLADEASVCAGVLIVPAGALLTTGTVTRFAAALAADPGSSLVYGDIALGEPGYEVPLLFPTFDYERWLEQGYGALCFALPADRAMRAVRQGANSLYHLATAQFTSATQGRAEVIHLPGIAARIPPLDLRAAQAALCAATDQHLRARGIPAAVHARVGSVLPAVQVSRHLPQGRVSLIIPTRDRADLLEPCLASLQSVLVRSTVELLIVDNGSSDPTTRALFDRVRQAGGRILEEPGPFNYARLCNRAAQVAAGEFLCFLNNDIECVEPDWLDELLSRLADPGADAAGAVLRWPSAVVQHGGVVLGPRFEASHAFTDRFASDPGYGDLLRVASQPSAVTGACLLVRRSAYEAVGGMDEVHFPVNFNDVDLCLKIGARGGRIVLSPHLHIVHHESATRGRDIRPDQIGRFQRELRALRAGWGHVMEADPAYNPLLAWSNEPYTALACPPRSFAARSFTIPSPSGTPGGV